jgi:hypothetical protein
LVRDLAALDDLSHCVGSVGLLRQLERGFLRNRGPRRASWA